MTSPASLMMIIRLLLVLLTQLCLLNPRPVSGLAMKIQLLRNDSIIQLLNQDCEAGTSENFTDSCLPSHDHHKPWYTSGPRDLRDLCCEQLSYWHCIEGLVERYCHDASLQAVQTYQKPLFQATKCALFEHDFDYGLCDDDRLQPGFSWIVVIVVFLGFVLVTVCCGVMNRKRKRDKADKVVKFSEV